MKKSKSQSIINLYYNGSAVNPKLYKQLTSRSWVGLSKANKVPYLGNTNLEITEETPCGLGIKSNQFIPKGTIIANYEGLLERYNPNVVYQYGVSYDQTTVNAQKYGGVASLINHGLPNCAFSYANGQPVIVALTDIPKGEFLHTDYGFKYSSSSTPYYDIEGIKKSITYLLGKIADPRILNNIGKDKELRLNSKPSMRGGESKSTSSNQTNIEIKYIESLLKYLFKTPLSLVELLTIYQISYVKMNIVFDEYTLIPISVDEINTCHLITSLMLSSNQAERVVSTYLLLEEKTIERLCFTIHQTEMMMGAAFNVAYSQDIYNNAAKHLMNNCFSFNQVTIALDPTWYQEPDKLDNLQDFPKTP